MNINERIYHPFLIARKIVVKGKLYNEKLKVLGKSWWRTLLQWNLVDINFLSKLIFWNFKTFEFKRDFSLKFFFFYLHVKELCKNQLLISWLYVLLVKEFINSDFCMKIFSTFSEEILFQDSSGSIFQFWLWTSPSFVLLQLCIFLV